MVGIGNKAAAVLQKVLTITIAVVGIILVVVSTLRGNPSNMKGQILVGSDCFSVFKNILSVAVVAPFFLFGFDVIPQAAEEIKVPLNKLGRLMILSIAMAVGFYGLVVLSVGYGLNSFEVAESISGSGLVAADAMAKLFNSQVMAKVLIVGGLCGIVTSWNSFIIGGSRALMAMADSYLIPHFFSKTHPKYKTPYVALIGIGILSIVSLFFGRVMLTWISDSASFACCVSYCMVSIAFVRLRKIEPDLKRPFKVRNHRLVGFLAVTLSGFMGVAYLVPGTGCTLTAQEFAISGGWAVIGMIFAVICKMKYKEKFGKE